MPEGNVKILDFGLAKALTGEAETTNATQSPTITAAMTRPGVILGTAAYMSPEQARGATVDKRADIWAFGVVLFEMLAGQTCFTGDTITDILAAVVRAEPDWAKLPAGTPPRVRDLLCWCLSKDRKRRLHDIADARLELEEALAPGASIMAGTEAEPAPVGRSGASSLERSAWALLLIIIAALTFFVTRWTVREPAAPDWNGSQLGGPEIAAGPRISPDRSMLAFQTLVDGQNQVAVMKPRILKIATNGNQPAQTLMGLTREVNIFDMDRDGNLYLEQFESPMDWLHVSPAQNHAERIAQLPVIPGRNGYLTCLPDDRVVLQLPSAGGFYLMLVDRGGERVPLAGTSEWASPPRDAGWARPDRVPDR